MSELKGQLLGMLLVLTVFGIMAGILVPKFTEAAKNVAENVSVTDSGAVQLVVPATNGGSIGIL
jgi:type II secretory pathway pseudopilin PulG